MAEHEECQGCKQLHNCRDIYAQLGASRGTSVSLGVVVVFLLPLVVFVASLSAGRWAAGLLTERAGLRTGIALVVAVAATLGWMLAGRVIVLRVYGSD